VVCGECYYCRRGIFNYCENFRVGIGQGGFCEYGVSIPPNMRIIPEGVSYEQATFTEPLACCINGSRMCDIKMGDDVVIVGNGPIGLIHVQLAKRQGARVIACDLIEERIEKAKELGADNAVNPTVRNAHPTEDAIEKVKELTDGRGANAVLVAVGSAKAMEMALQMAGICATVNFFAGMYPPEKIELDPNLIHYKQIYLTGSHDFTPHDFTTALKMIEHNIIEVEPLISHLLPLEDIKEGLDTVAGQKGFKVVVKME